MKKRMRHNSKRCGRVSLSDEKFNNESRDMISDDDLDQKGYEVGDHI
jgi:hypothetical protein